MNSTIRQSPYCAVPLGTVVYAGPRSRDEFDRLPLPETVGEWHPDHVGTLLKNDGQQWEKRIRAKSLEGTGGITVIFQWSEQRRATAQVAA